jgi:hypothetical protein
MIFRQPLHFATAVHTAMTIRLKNFAPLRCGEIVDGCVRFAGSIRIGPFKVLLFMCLIMASVAGIMNKRMVFRPMYRALAVELKKAWACFVTLILASLSRFVFPIARAFLVIDLDTRFASILETI